MVTGIQKAPTTAGGRPAGINGSANRGASRKVAARWLEATIYRLATLLLMIAALCATFSAIVLGIATWPAGAIVTALVAISRAYKRKLRLTTLGSAIWASEKDIRQAGMLDAKSGLIIGRLL
jgi:hypothetical protein